ncbi:MAG: sulfatase [Planctomycetales bacterium]|nr:sulfatase [Planctomycetales bacterium]
MKLTSYCRVSVVSAIVIMAVAAPTKAADAPNFILIMSDDQSWVGSSAQIIPDDPRTRSDYFKTPNIERLAQMGMRFTQGYSPAASCCPTRRAIQTGQTPARHEYHNDRDGWTETYRTQLNIPRMLKAADARYATAHFGKWDHRYDEITPEAQGYDESHGYTSNATGGSKNTGGPAAQNDPKRIDTITRDAMNFMDRCQAAERPFYLQISHYAVHLDIFYNQATLDRVKREQAPGKKHAMPEFAAMTSDLDDSVGRILDHLNERNLRKNTYLIFMSDNGGRNTIPNSPETRVHRNAPLRDGKHSFYEGGVRVPFFVLGPGVQPGSVCHVPVTGLDLLPTFADLAGCPGQLPDNIDGGSLRRLLHNEGQGKVERNKPFLIFQEAANRRAISAIRLGDYKLVKTWKSRRLELFDLSRDLSEVDDLSSKNPEKTNELESLLVGFLAEVGAATKGK